MNSNEPDKNSRFGIRALAFAIIGAVFIAASLFCIRHLRHAPQPPAQEGQARTDSQGPGSLLPTRSFVVDRVAGNCVFSADTKWLAAGQQDGTVAVWNVANGERAGNWSGDGILAFLPGPSKCCWPMEQT